MIRSTNCVVRRRGRVERKKKKRNPTAKFSNDQEAPFRAHSRAKLDHSEELGAKCDAEKRGVRRSGVVYPDGYVKHRVCVCVSSGCDTNRLSLLRTVTFRRDALAPVAQRGRFASSPTHTLSAYKRDFLPHPCFVSGTFFSEETASSRTCHQRRCCCLGCCCCHNFVSYVNLWLAKRQQPGNATASSA